ncbi:hypothetical protein [Bacillus taeanensis]|uniref:Uncharacterized protein n=1 Tax=Bacillus taeanensis TaxID=273032 RepID=A0A366XWE0_9BACI|nr:hypothetical protein [Bacillus taeanensis]RBW68261.1 hypothetical protein DS031_17980 [Bacillus taeanensis]
MRTIVDFLFGLFIGMSPDEIQFKRNVKKLKNENWFKEKYDDALYYERIFQDADIRNYLTQKGIVKKLRNDKKEKEHFLSIIK